MEKERDELLGDRFRAYFDKIRPGLADYVAEALKAYAASL